MTLGEQAGPGVSVARAPLQETLGKNTKFFRNMDIFVLKRTLIEIYQTLSAINLG